MGFQEDVVSRLRTNFVRGVVATLLGLSACLVVWWPQGAAGSGDVELTPAQAEATQQTPTPDSTPTVTVAPTKTPTVTVGPTKTPTVTVAPPSAPPPAQPTKKPTKKPTTKPTKKPDNGGNGGNGGGTKPPNMPNGGSNGGSGGGNHPSSGGSSNDDSTPSTVATQAVTTQEDPPSIGDAPTAHPTTEAASPPPAAATATDDAKAGKNGKGNGGALGPPATPGADQASSYDTYLANSEPVESKKAPVWVVPGILLVLTSMLALLGGVLGRGPVPAVAKAAVAKRRTKPEADDES